MYSFKKLDNGLDVILIKRDSMMSAAIIFCVKAGSSNEKNENAGLSHLIEHISFRATKKRNIYQIKHPIEEVGGVLNAFTSKIFTVFYSKVPSVKVNDTIDILSDIIYNPLLDEKDIEKEKAIIIEEISSYEDDPLNIVFEKLYEGIYDNDFSRPILGYKDTVLNMNKDVIRDYHEKFYAPENSTVIISGKFDEDIVLKSLSKIKNTYKPNNTIKSPKMTDEEITLRNYKVDLASNYVVEGFKAPSKLENEYYSTLILNTFLGSGMSSLLFSKIREEEGLAYEVASDYVTYPKSGLLLFYAATTNENLEKLLVRMHEIPEEIKNDNTLEKWFEYGKKRLIGKLTLEIENNLSLALNILDLYINYGKIITIEDFIQKIEKIEIEDVLNTSNKIFSNNRYISILSPKNNNS